jgi:hypothetical protein
VKKFINVSNHPSAKWSAEQMAAAVTLGGEVSDLPFPNVPPTASEADIATLADTIVAQIPDDAVVMVSGEFTLTYALISRLRKRGLTVVAATTNRVMKDLGVQFRSFE